MFFWPYSMYIHFFFDSPFHSTVKITKTIAAKGQKTGDIRTNSVRFLFSQSFLDFKYDES